MTFRGRHFVPVAKDVPVRYGETYVFAATIRGTGELNSIYRIDDKALTVAFDVDDDMYDPPTSMENAYLKDSVQFALDPRNDGADMTEFTLGRLADGTPFLYKSRNYTTPELPDNITRRGRVADAQVDYAEREGGWRIRARIPLNEVYPLKADATAFGFNFLVNDCDGAGRTYREWARGIGGAKCSSEYGCLLLQGGEKK